MDGVGEYETAVIGVGRGGAIERKLSIGLPHSIGLFYSAFTAFLGFEVNEGEYKVMGLAAYGQPRLRDELDALDRVNQAVQANLTPQLYIVGYTDTVGDPGKNQKLSNDRAKAIARYFYEQGFWAEIYYAGMGERGLRVETGDSVDEVRNRRALYLIAFQKPGSGGAIPSNWSKLAGARGRPAGFELPPLPPQWADFRSKKKDKGDDGDSASGGGDDSGGGDGAFGAIAVGAIGLGIGFLLSNSSGRAGRRGRRF